MAYFATLNVRSISIKKVVEYNYQDSLSDAINIIQKILKNTKKIHVSLDYDGINKKNLWLAFI